MKKVAIAALMLGLSGMVSLASAAPITVSAATYTLTYDDSFGNGVLPSLGVVGDAVTFSGGTAVTSSPFLGAPSIASYAIDSYNGRPFPVILTAKAGFKITGVTETISGAYSASVSPLAAGTALSGAAFQSYWLASNVVQGNSGYQLLAQLNSDTPPFSAAGNYDVSGTLALGFSADTVKLSATRLSIFSDASGVGQAQTSLSSYKLNVQTAAVPEPETLALVMVGLGVVGFSLRGRRAAH